ncbi:urotensin-2B isoform X3 [Lonchura striata]|uniref:urotensin-2B isoform X2 n=1 Tax=Lonchura striata TaxID=40157 RepID=UPI000B4C4CB1|nr:urotensin-2B isoform X2 [Lonchura striata domestica]
MLLGSGNVEKMWSAQLCLGVLTILTMALCVPSTHGDPFLLQENRVLPEREDTNHENTLLTLLLNKKFAWRRPESIDWELAKKFEELEEPAFGNTASEGLSGLEDEDEPFPKLPCWV